MKYLSILFLLALASCGGGGGSVPKAIGGSTTGSGCTVQQVVGGANITCNEETVFIPNGTQGIQGEKGDKGDTGSNVFADALAIHTAKRQSVFKLTVWCNFDINGDNNYGDNFIYNGNTVSNYEAHTGSGFLIENRKVATNKHVLSDDACDQTVAGAKWEGRIYKIQVQSVSSWRDEVGLGTTYSETIYRSNMDLYHHSNKDLAKLSVSATFVGNKQPFEIETQNEDILTPTLSMSFPLGLDDMITNIGEVINDSASDFTGYDFLTSNDTDSGSSGSPIIDINTGKVIGIITAGFNNSEIVMNPSIIIHADRLNDF